MFIHQTNNLLNSIKFECTSHYISIWDNIYVSIINNVCVNLKKQCFCQRKFMEMAIILHTLFIDDDVRFYEFEKREIIQRKKFLF